MVVSTALTHPAGYTLDSFLAMFTNKVDPFGHTYVEQDLVDAVRASRYVAIASH